MAPELPPSTKCRFCPATIVRVSTRLGGTVLLDPEPDPHGAWVVDHDALGFTAYRYVYLTHVHRKRYRLHTNRCRPPRDAPAPMTSVKPDPTAGLAFPKRKAELKFPPLEQLLAEVRRGR